VRVDAVALGVRHRHTETELAVVEARGLQVFDRDLDRLARRDVGDGRREQVRRVLAHETRVASRVPRRAVDVLRLLALVDLALDHAVPDLHREPIDGRVVGQRQRVYGLVEVAARVREALHDGHARDDARDRYLNVRGERRRRRVYAGRRR